MEAELERRVPREPVPLPLVVEPAPVEPAPVERSEPRVEAPALRCPYCHDSFSSSRATSVCGTCLARHHAPCWRSHGRCASCSSIDELAPRFVRPESASRWSVLWPVAVVVLTGLLVVTTISRQLENDATSDRLKALEQQQASDRETASAAVPLRLRNNVLESQVKLDASEKAELEHELASLKREHDRAAGDVEKASLKAREDNEAAREFARATRRSLVDELMRLNKLLLLARRAGVETGSREDLESRIRAHNDAKDFDDAAIYTLETTSLSPQTWATVIRSIVESRCLHELAGESVAVLRCDEALRVYLKGGSPRTVAASLKGD